MGILPKIPEFAKDRVRVVSNLVFPNPDDLPAASFQISRGVFIPSAVVFYLFPPKSVQSFLPLRVLPTVPKIAVQEYAYFLFWKDYVGLAFQANVIKPEPFVSQLSQSLDEVVLEFSARGPYSRHYLASFLS